MFLVSTKQKVLQFANDLGIDKAETELKAINTIQMALLDNNRILDEKIKTLKNTDNLFWFEETLN